MSIHVRTFVVLLLCFFAFSCKQKNDIPKDILKPEQMKPVLFDLVLAEALQEVKPDQYPANQTALRDKVLQSHKLNAKTFQKSLDYYQQHPQLYKQLADSLATYASKLATSVMQEPVKSKQNGRYITDSTGSSGDFKRNR